FVFDDTLAFSADSRHWSVVAGDLAHERLFFAIDGRARVTLPAIEGYSAAARHASDPLFDRPPDDTLIQWSRAEAERAANPDGVCRAPAGRKRQIAPEL